MIAITTRTRCYGIGFDNSDEAARIQLLGRRAASLHINISEHTKIGRKHVVLALGIM